MSASMVRKGLELFSEDLPSLSSQGLSRKKRAASSTLTTTNKTGLKKLKRRQDKGLRSGVGSLTVKGKKVKSSVEQYKRKKAKDNTRDATKFLSLLSSKKTSGKVVKQVSEYQQRRAVKKPKKQPQKPKEAKSCFSEEDFARFEREYFVGPRRR